MPHKSGSFKTVLFMWHILHIKLSNQHKIKKDYKIQVLILDFFIN